VILRRHEEGVVIEPAGVLSSERGERLRHCHLAAREGAAQKREAVFKELRVIDLRGIIPEIDALQLALFQQAVLDEEVEIDGVLYDATCPSCGEEITFDEETLEKGSIRCPNCGEILEFDLDGTADEELPDEGGEE
jgi:transposase